MEGYCSTGQTPQWAVVPVEEEEEELFDRPKPTTGCSANGIRRSIILQMFHTHSFIYHRRYTVLVNDSLTSRKTSVFNICEIFSSGLLNVNRCSVDLC
jgi:hypothetical protein